MKNTKVSRKLHWDDKGALEGLPLYLIILVVIAAVAIVVIFSYMSTLKTEELKRIDIYIDGEKTEEVGPGDHEVYIVAVGTDGKKLEDVTITIGGEVNTAKKTDSDGRADFGTVSFIADGTPYTIPVTASYAGGNVNTPVDEEILVQ